MRLKLKISVSHQLETLYFFKINWTNPPGRPQFKEMTSQDENKPGLSWTVLDIERDVTYSLPIFLGVGKYKAMNKWMYALCKYDNTQKSYFTFRCISIHMVLYIQGELSFSLSAASVVGFINYLEERPQRFPPWMRSTAGTRSLRRPWSTPSPASTTGSRCQTTCSEMRGNFVSLFRSHLY